jgi:hypothetical protein
MAPPSGGLPWLQGARTGLISPIEASRLQVNLGEDRMDERERRRARLAGRATALAGGRRLRDALPPLRGTRSPVILALPDDTVAGSLRKAEKLGGRAHVLVLEEQPDDGLRIHLLRIELGYKPATEQDDQPERPAPEDLELSTLLRDTEPGGQSTFSSWESEAEVSFLTSIALPAPAQP